MFLFGLQAAERGLWERISDWYQTSLIGELLSYVWDTYFTVHFNPYENFVFGESAGERARAIIFAVCAGLFFAAVLALYIRNGTGKFVRALIEQGCFDEKTAKTLSELGFFHDSTVRGELAYGANLRRVVRCVEKEAHLARLAAQQSEDGEGQTSAEGVNENFRLDFVTAHFYLPEELRYHAENRFRKQKKPVLFLLATAVFCVILAMLLCYFIPDLIQLADNIISFASPK